MKKTIISIFIISTSFSLSFAEESFFNSVIETKINAIKDIRSLFVEDKVDSKLENKKGEKVLMSNPEVKDMTLDKIEGDIKPVLLLCENKIKIKDRKDKINLNIKNQIKDKNKLTDKLLEIANTVSTSSKESIEEKVIKLETEVGSAIKIQRNMLNIIASSTNNVCEISFAGNAPAETVSVKLGADDKSVKLENKTENKEYAALIKSIKKLELENDKQLEKINNIIKRDIKSILVEINKKEIN